VGPIIGVVSDFHFMSLHSPFKPMVLRVSDQTRFIAVRVNPGETNTVVTALQNTWAEMANGEQFYNSFLDELFDALHQGEEKV